MRTNAHPPPPSQHPPRHHGVKRGGVEWMEAAARAIIIPLFWHFLYIVLRIDWITWIVFSFFFGFYSGNLQEKEILSFIASSLYNITCCCCVAHVLVVIIPCGHPQTHRPRYHLSDTSRLPLFILDCNCQRENKIIKSFITHLVMNGLTRLHNVFISRQQNSFGQNKIKKQQAGRGCDISKRHMTLWAVLPVFLPSSESPTTTFGGGGGSSADKLVNARRFPFSSALAPRRRLLQIETDWTL